MEADSNGTGFRPLDYLQDGWLEIAPGVKKIEYFWSDAFVGTPQALAAAGIARADQLPGQPGMRKSRVTIFPDGRMPAGHPQRNHGASRTAGAKSIERASKTTYRVFVTVADDVGQRRVDEHHLARRLRAVPRPIGEIAVSRGPSEHHLAEPAEFRRAHIRLVWSAPR